MSEPPADLHQARRRLAARGRELDALHLLGRRASEARTPGVLLDAVIGALHQTVELDLALVAQQWDGSPAIRLHLARPFQPAYLDAVVERARRFLGWPPGAATHTDRHVLDGFDEARGERGTFREQDLVLLPLLRGPRPASCLIVVPAEASDEQRMRLFYSASNQLALHLDRILNAREAEADRFRAIVSAMPQGVLLVDARLRVAQANPAATRMLESCGLVGEFAMRDGLERLGLTALVERVRNGGQAVAEGEAHVEGDRIWSVTASCLPGEDEELVLVLSDRTESRRLQQQLAHAEKMSSLGQMISGVAHELNNPLASIVGYAQLLRGSAGGDEKLTRRLEVLGREAERCRKIVQNLLSFARRREPERKRLSLNQVVENVVALLRYQLRVDGIRIERDLAKDVPSIEGDAHELEQVLVNLLTNAAQAIRETSETGTVTLRTRAKADHTVVLEIHDTGPGVPEDMRSKIFDPFFTTKAPGEGTGLGLALVYGIVTAHGGTVEALAHDARGTTFRITLPARPAEPRPVAGSPTRASATPARSGHVLVVDDDEAVAHLICEALGKDGLRTRQVRGGREALEQLAAASFDLIVCDVKMPDMSGERMYEELRRTRPDVTRRLLWTTGDTLSTGPARLAERTGLDVLTKPFDLDELRDRVRRRLASDEPAD